MTEEQRPARAYQPWTDQEYGVLEKRYYEQNWSVERIALSLSRYPSEVGHTIRRLRDRKEAVEHRQAIKNFPERLTARYGRGLREFPVAHLSRGLCLDAVHKPKTPILDLSEIEKRIPDIYEEAWKHIIRKARRLVINGKNYDTLLRKARERVHLQIEISATLAGGK